MTRLQKKCMVFSLGLHSLLAVILVASAGFGTAPPPQDLQVLTMIPANIVDKAGSGGGTPVVNLIQPQTVRPAAQPAPQPQPVQPEKVEHVEHVQAPTPPQRKEVTRPPPEPDEPKDLTMDSKLKAPRPSPKHEIRVSYTPINAKTTSRKKPLKDTAAATETYTSARAEARRLKEIESSLAELASGVRNSGSPNTIVDVQGIGGGPAFAGYRNVVFTYYYRAWVTPDGSSSRLASADAKVTIARDGSIVSAELVRSSDDRALDKSVERALRAVTKLPPFPPEAQDEQRTFVIRFSLDAKELAG
jgi:TonB family protein